MTMEQNTAQSGQPGVLSDPLQPSVYRTESSLPLEYYVVLSCSVVRGTSPILVLWGMQGSRDKRSERMGLECLKKLWKEGKETTRKSGNQQDLSRVQNLPGWPGMAAMGSDSGPSTSEVGRVERACPR